jgi:hypothetical protein
MSLERMQHASIFTRILIASNFDNEFSPESVKLARLLLSSRSFRGSLDFKRIWQEEARAAASQARKCSICANPEIEYSEDMYFCTEENEDEGEIELPDFIPGIISECQVGRENVCEKRGYWYAKGKFHLCHNCFMSHQKNKQDCLRISIQEYYGHPMYEYYYALGFTKIKHELLLPPV